MRWFARQIYGRKNISSNFSFSTNEIIFKLVFILQIFSTEHHGLFNIFTVFIYFKTCIRVSLWLLWASYSQIRFNHFGINIKHISFLIYSDKKPLLTFIKTFLHPMESLFVTIGVVLNEIATETLKPEIAQYFLIVLDTFFILIVLYFKLGLLLYEKILK